MGTSPSLLIPYFCRCRKRKQRAFIPTRTKRPKQSSNSNGITIGSVKLSASSNNYIKIEPQINHKVIQRAWKPPTTNIYHELTRHLNDRSTHIEDFKKAILMNGIIPYLPRNLVAGFLNVLSCSTSSITSFLKKARSKSLSIAVIHTAVKELKLKRTMQSYNEARKRYTQYLKQINQYNEDKELVNLYFVRKPVKEWSHLNIVQYAFYLSLDDEVIYIILALQFNGQQIQDIEKADLEILQDIYKYKELNVDKTFKFIQTLNKCIIWSLYDEENNF